MRSRKGRRGLGARQYLNACLAGLLVGDLVLEGRAALQPKDTVVTLAGTAAAPGTLAGAAQVVADKGPKIKAILSGMDRGLRRHLGLGTWDAVVAALPGETRRDAVIAGLRAAAEADDELDPRTALLLSMMGPAKLLEVVAPERGPARRHARNRIDHGPDGTPFGSIARTVRKIIAQDQAASAAATIVVVSG